MRAGSRCVLNPLRRGVRPRPSEGREEAPNGRTIQCRHVASHSRRCRGAKVKRRPSCPRRGVSQVHGGRRAQKPRPAYLFLNLETRPPVSMQARAAAGPGGVRQRVDLEVHRVALLAPGGLHLDHGAVGHLDVDEVVFGVDVGPHLESSFGLVVGDLGDAGRLAATIAQVVELGAADLAAADHGDRVDVGRVEGEDPLHALAERDLADGERARDARAVLAADADALVVLDAGARAFGHLVADADGVAGLEVGNGLPEGGDLLRLQLRDEVQRTLLCCPGWIPGGVSRPQSSRSSIRAPVRCAGGPARDQVAVPWSASRPRPAARR